MKKTALIILPALVFLGGFLIFYQNRLVKKETPTAIKQTDRQTSAKHNWEPKTDVQALVTVTVTPVDVSAQAKEWKFDIVMDTHSVELDQDMSKITILVDDQGNEYKSLRWEGAPAGGHHREGALVFERIKSNSNSIELKIFSIGDVVRSFSWQIK